ncbi:MAG TPA: ABC transporter permease [Pyrinomonadaceae bacterium]
MKSFVRRARGLWRADEIGREIDEEMRFHIDMRAEENVRRGMSPEEARREALRRFGNRTRVRERGYEVRGGGWLETVWHDLRYGARVLRKNPGFAAAAVFTLALGIGVNTTVFTLCNAFAWRPLPVRDPGALVRVERVNPDGTRAETTSYPDHAYFDEHNQVFAGMLVYAGPAPLTMSESPSEAGAADAGARAEVAQIAFVSGNYFSLLGGATQLGRTFTSDEDTTQGTHPVAVLSHKYWQRRFGADTRVLGKTFAINGRQLNVVGVAAADFYGVTPLVPDVWVPVAMQNSVLPIFDSRDRGATFFRSVGRLKPGVTTEQAQAEIDVLAGQLARSFPETNERVGAAVEPASSFARLDGFLRTMFFLVLAADLLVLLVACANVANLLLARASARRREIAVRLALGATRGRLVRQLVTESLMLSFAGGALGLLLAVWTLDVVLKVVLAGLPPEMGVVNTAFDLSPDVRVFAYTLLLTLVAGVTFGLAPALQASRPDLVSALKQADGGAARVRRRGIFRLGLRDVLVGVQVAVCLVLLVGAGLLIRGVRKGQSLDAGYETARFLVVEPNLLSLGHDAARTAEMHRQLSERLQALPGVESVTLSTRTAGARKTAVAAVAEPGAQGGGRQLRAYYTMVAPNYFETTGIAVLRGRGFTEQETRETAPRVAILSEATARRLFVPGEEPLGRRVRLGVAPARDAAGRQFEPEPYSPSCEVIGVAKDVRSVRISEVDDALVYLPLRPTNEVQVWLLARTRGEPRSVLGAVRDEVERFDRGIYPNVTLLEETVAQQLLPARVLTLACSVLGAMGLVLASIGLYGVISYSVAQRTHEIGVRMALGARRRDVLRLVIGGGMRVVLAGVVAGLIGAAALSKVLVGFLYGLSPLDPLAFGGVSLLLATVALFAMYLPARRAARVDPVIALRHE